MAEDRTMSYRQRGVCSNQINLRTLLLVVVIVFGAHLLESLPSLLERAGTQTASASIPVRVLSASAKPIGRSNKAEGPLRFVLYRLIGNNMPPLQCPSQLLWNTQYTLAHEAAFPNCTKRWVLNQILNETERALLVDTLLAAGYTMEDIIIRRINFTELKYHRKEKWVNLVTAQNEGRNAAIEDGVKLGAEWILPFDGNQFITNEAWDIIVRSAAISDQMGFKYFKVPAHRLPHVHNASWVHGNSTFEDLVGHRIILTESQFAFRHDAEERFLPGMTYGLNNKLEVMKRACGPKRKRTCHCANAGNDGEGIHNVSLRSAMKCGYTLRLWSYPCDKVDTRRSLEDVMYRMGIRQESKKRLMTFIEQRVAP